MADTVDYASVTGCRVFSSTRSSDRMTMGERISEWMVSHPDIQIVDIRVVQSSDDAYHCLSIVILWKPRSQGCT